MATYKPTNIQPVCRAVGCTHGVSVLSIQGTIASWMKTCKRHTYKDLPEEKERSKSTK